MSFTYGFYNSKNGDRKYNARQMALMFDALITNGVMAHVGDCFNVTPISGMSVAIGTGFAWFDHTWSYNDSEIIMTAERSDVLLDRIDALILEIDESESVRENSIKWITGTPATKPVRPTLINNEHVHQYPLKYITIPANSIMISAANIKNMVGTSECPFATGILEGMDVDMFVAQWDAQFNAWFQSMRDRLDGDTAGNLQNQIDNLTATNEQLEEELAVNKEACDGKVSKTIIVTTINTNLNDYVEDGTYFFDNDYIPTNIPTGSNGWLEVMKGGNGAVKQLWHRFGTPGSNDHQMYLRTRNINGVDTWGDWVKIMSANGGIFTGDIVAYETPRKTRGIYNEETRTANTDHTGALQSVKYFINEI